MANNGNGSNGKATDSATLEGKIANAERELHLLEAKLTDEQKKLRERTDTYNRACEELAHGEEVDVVEIRNALMVQRDVCELLENQRQQILTPLNSLYVTRNAELEREKVLEREIELRRLESARATAADRVADRYKEWTQAQREFFIAEERFMCLRDQMNAERQARSWEERKRAMAREQARA